MKNLLQQTMIKCDLIKLVFYISMGIGISFLFFYAIIYEGNPFENILFTDPWATFTDYYDCIVLSRNENPYALGSSYPALANLIFAFFSKMIPESLILKNGVEASFVLASKISFIIYNIFFVSALVILIFKNKNGSDFEKFATVIFLFYSTPLLFLFERGNILLVSLVMLMIFIFGKDSKKPWVREISYISLAISAAIKIYPAIFGLLLIYDKKYIEAMRSAIYGILFFLLPFFAYGGFSALYAFHENLNGASAFMSHHGFGYMLNLSNTIKVYAILIGHRDSVHYQIIADYAPYAIALVSVISLFFIKSEWKRTALLATITILVPKFTGVYVLVMMVFPLILFLDAQGERAKKDWFYLLFFILIFIPIPFTAEIFLAEVNKASRGYYFYNLGTMVESLAVLLMSVFINLEALNRAWEISKVEIFKK